MTILVTGSDGKTASHLADLLVSTHLFLVASRRPRIDSKYPSVQFEWLDENTWGIPFSHRLALESPITAVYLVSPDVQEVREQVAPFVQFAIQKGVKRFVLLSAWEISEDHAAVMGPAHAALKKFEETHGIEWAVLRPHYFMENFAEPYHLPCIKNESKIYAAAGDGVLPFVSARDIAAVAYRILVDKKPHNTDYIITGGVALCYNQVAKVFSEILGRDVQYEETSSGNLKELLVKFGVGKDQAQYLADLDVRVSKGEGSEPTNVVRDIVGRDPLRLEDVVSDLKNVWQAGDHVLNTEP